ncbi:MAG: glucosaminidase domain-containing protein [Treponema sp.]|nr:glucosaminidase domain-containing protein [Treponema sp.]
MAAFFSCTTKSTSPALDRNTPDKEGAETPVLQGAEGPAEKAVGETVEEPVLPVDAEGRGEPPALIAAGEPDPAQGPEVAEISAPPAAGTEPQPAGETLETPVDALAGEPPQEPAAENAETPGLPEMEGDGKQRVPINTSRLPKIARTPKRANPADLTKPAKLPQITRRAVKPAETPAKNPPEAPAERAGEQPGEIQDTPKKARTEAPAERAGEQPGEVQDTPEETRIEAPIETAAIPPPEEAPEEPPFFIPEAILGVGRIPFSALASFLLNSNPQADSTFIETLALIYAEEAALEGVNHDIAFAQMCLETGFLRFGGLVTPDMNNFCGLGAIGDNQRGEYFPSPRIGVRAHIQHLKAYATNAPLEQELVDPRYRWVRYGSAPTIAGLAGTWAVDTTYAEKIKRILRRLYTYSAGSRPLNQEAPEGTARTRPREIPGAASKTSPSAAGKAPPRR